jgi:hypothetical protein
MFSSEDRNTIGLEETRGYQFFDNIFVHIAKTVCLSKETRFSQRVLSCDIHFIPEGGRYITTAKTPLKRQSDRPLQDIECEVPS